MTAATPAARVLAAVGFDLDGTLFDHRGSATDAVSAFLSDFGVNATADVTNIWFAAEDAEFEQWRAGRISFQEQRRRRLRTVLTELNIDFIDTPSELDRLFEQYLIEYRRAWRPFPDVAEVLASLRGRGYRLGQLTNGSEEQQLDKLFALGLDDSFDAVCISEAIGFQKPDARAFDALARSLDVEPQRCLFVGDSADKDVAGATAAGMRALLIERHDGSASSLAAIESALLAG